MSWLTLTAADFNDVRAAKLIDALRTKALAEGQTDPVPRLTQVVIDEIRRCIGFCASTPLDLDPAKIPAGLKDLAVQKIVRTAKGRLLQALTDDEKDAERLYQKRLEQLTRCEWPVDTTATPLTTATVAQGGAVQVITAGRRQPDLGGL